MNKTNLEQPVVTVVIPVYNTERFLDRCVESVTGQTYRKLQILLIDDGSPDGAPAICERWAARDPRVRVIHKRNEGLGMARNTGIAQAEGEYLCFVDSDDYIAPDLVGKVLARSLQTRAEVVLFGYIAACPDQNRFVPLTPDPSRELYQGREVLELLLPELLGEDPITGKSANLPLGACGALYSMDLIRRTGWRFVSERQILSEDLYSLLELYGHVDSVAVVKEALYYCCENPGSLSRSYHRDRYGRIVHFYRACLRLCRERSYPEGVAQRCAQPYLVFTIDALKQEIAQAPSFREAAARLRPILEDETLQQVLEQTKHHKTGWKKRLLYRAMRHRSCFGVYLLVRARSLFRRKG